MKKVLVISLFIIIISFLIGIYFYPVMPERMMSHWNSVGEVNGYMGKFWGLFLMPLITLAIFFLLIFIIRLDPLQKNIKLFERYYHGFILVLVLFMFFLYSLSILANLGFKFNLIYLLIPAFAVLFFYLGILLEKAKRNWFIGIRTPWTLSNDKVWDKTHKLGGKLFKICAIISLFGLIYLPIAIWLVIIPLIIVSIYLIIYSYLEFKKLDKIKTHN